MANSIYDELNRSLFLQMDRLQDCEPEELDGEVERSKQVANLAGQIIANQKAAFDLVKYQVGGGVPIQQVAGLMPKPIGGRDDG